MFKTAWGWVTTAAGWIKSLWLDFKAFWIKFEAWVAGWAPGLKTKIVTALGWIGSAAAVLQEYVTGIPLNHFITDTQIAVVGIVLFTLAFWLRGISERVKERVVTPS